MFFSIQRLAFSYLELTILHKKSGKGRRSKIPLRRLRQYDPHVKVWRSINYKKIASGVSYIRMACAKPLSIL